MKTLAIDPAGLDRKQSYHLTCSIVLPRPIGWLSTVSGAGSPNLAPFSFFNALCSHPPTVAVSVGRRRGQRKDTAQNLLATKEAVVHIPTEKFAQEMLQSSGDFPPETSEFEMTGLSTTASTKVRPERIAGCPVAMETKLVKHFELGASAVDVFVLEVVLFHIDEGILKEDQVDPRAFKAIGRLGDAFYISTDTPFEIN
jgi:flavin reductase (DIM6/NTAB) family NADH-FMN oxidoreductase RutF